MWDFKPFVAASAEPHRIVVCLFQLQPSTESQAVSLCTQGSCRSPNLPPRCSTTQGPSPGADPQQVIDIDRLRSGARLPCVTRREARATVRMLPEQQLRPAGGSCQRLRRPLAGGRPPGERAAAGRAGAPGGSAARVEAPGVECARVGGGSVEAARCGAPGGVRPGWSGPVECGGCAVPGTRALAFLTSLSRVDAPLKTPRGGLGQSLLAQTCRAARSRREAS